MYAYELKPKLKHLSLVSRYDGEYIFLGNTDSWEKVEKEINQYGQNT